MAFEQKRSHKNDVSLHHAYLVAALWTSESERWNAASWNAQPCIAGRTIDLAFAVQAAFVVAEFGKVLLGFLLVIEHFLLKRFLFVPSGATTQTKKSSLPVT